MISTIKYIILFILFTPSFLYSQTATTSYLRSGIQELHNGYNEWNVESFVHAKTLFDEAINREPDNYLPYYWKGVAQFHMVLFYLGEREKTGAV
jgi:hypothetical protein